jgi:hypothetical protein
VLNLRESLVRERSRVIQLEVWLSGFCWERTAVLTLMTLVLLSLWGLGVRHTCASLWQAINPKYSQLYINALRSRRPFNVPLIYLHPKLSHGF